MLKRIGVMCLVGVGLLLSASVLPAADYSPKSKPHAKDPVAGAKNDLNAAQQRFSAAVARLRAATARLTQLSHDAPLKYKQVAQAHDSALALEGARDSLEQNRKELDDTSRELLEDLRDEPKYKQAVAERDALRAKLKALPFTSSFERKDTEHQLALAYAKVRKLEKDALEEDPDAKALADAVAESQSSLQDLDRQRDAEMANDPALASVRQSIMQAKADVANARVAAAAEGQKLAAARQKLSAEESKRNKGKAKNKSNKSKKKHR
jgi:hypothetical protein